MKHTSMNHRYYEEKKETIIVHSLWWYEANHNLAARHNFTIAYYNLPIGQILT